MSHLTRSYDEASTALSLIQRLEAEVHNLENPRMELEEHDYRDRIEAV